MKREQISNQETFIGEYNYTYFQKIVRFKLKNKKALCEWFALPEDQPSISFIGRLVGEKGQDWHLMTSAAFVSMILPLLVFLGLQRYFVRGMMAGSVKG